ncbi:hypothetical protein [Candidatus Poriferisodalis sp.]|uniref:hypothetical protein n=1 Tax=Candidatus Poriferisodalis sp. TaxID=3101277 RepID=UPI003D0A286D
MSARDALKAVAVLVVVLVLLALWTIGVLPWFFEWLGGLLSGWLGGLMEQLVDGAASAR